MKLACFITKDRLIGDSKVEALLAALKEIGAELYDVKTPEDIRPGTDVLLSLGGDGTFLSAAPLAYAHSLPVLGVNFGRLGFLSEYAPQQVVNALRDSGFEVEERELLKVSVEGADLGGLWPYALNEVSVSRISASMLGTDVCVDGSDLPTYWADGLLVATSSGSTAYSLSVGGPICLPDSKVFIVAPISPHNLNVRPLIIPHRSSVEISLRSRDEMAVFSMDNRTIQIPATAKIRVCAADRKLKRIRIGKSNFINALRTKLLWGEDVRNGKDMIL